MGDNGSEAGGVGSFETLPVVGCKAFDLVVGWVGNPGSCEDASSELKAAKLRLREA